MKLVSVASFTVLVYLNVVSGNIANHLLPKEQQSYGIGPTQDDEHKVTKTDVEESSKNGKNISTSQFLLLECHTNSSELE